MSLSATVADPLTEPVPPGWDDFVAAQRLPALWHSSVVSGAAWAARAASSLALVRDTASGEPVALFHARHVGVTAPYRYARPGRMPAVTLTRCRALPAGMAFAAQLPGPDRVEAVHAFERATRRRTGAGALGIAYRDLDGALVDAIPTARRRRVLLAPRMVLHNEWADVEAYRAALPGKWRANLRKRRDAVERDPTLAVDLDGTVEPAEACWLAELVRRRHRPRLVPRPPVSALHFARLAALPGTRFLTYRDAAGRLLAFTAVADTGTDLLSVAWGCLDRADGGRADLYLDQFHRMAELLVTTGRRRLVWGAASRVITHRYGARPDPLWAVVGLR
jgi:hypothetical protein